MENSTRRRGKRRRATDDRGVRASNGQEPRGVHESTLIIVFKILWRLFLTLTIGVVGGLLFLYITAVIVMYSSPAAREMVIYLHPLKNPFHNLTDPGKFGLKTTVNFYIDGPVGKLGAWHIPPVKSSTAVLGDGNPVVLYLHGNAFTRAAAHRIMLYKLLISLGYHVIAVDYRGFGDSEGSPSEPGLIDDGVAAWKWIKRRTGGAPVFIWGHSLGSGVASGVGEVLCEEGTPPSGIILEAPFNNVQDGARTHRITVPFRFLPYFKEVVIDELENVFRSDKRIAKIICPILILHDQDDDIIPVTLGRKLFEVAEKTRPKDAAAIKYIEFNEHLGHKFICNSEKLPEIMRNFVGH